MPKPVGIKPKSPKIPTPKIPSQPNESKVGSQQAKTVAKAKSPVLEKSGFETKNTKPQEIEERLTPGVHKAPPKVVSKAGNKTREDLKTNLLMGQMGNRPPVPSKKGRPPLQQVKQELAQQKSKQKSRGQKPPIPSKEGRPPLEELKQQMGGKKQPPEIPSKEGRPSSASVRKELFDANLSPEKRSKLEELDRHFYQPFPDVLKFKAPQGIYLRPDNPGVCREMSLQWVKRGFQGKPSLLDRKDGKTPLPTDSVPEVGTARMQDKFAKYAKGQSELDERAGLPKNENKSLPQLLGEYSDEQGMVLGKEKRVLIEPDTTRLRQGRLVFDHEDLSQKLMENLEPNKSYLVSLNEHNGGAHAIAIRTGSDDGDGNPTSIRFMDPNLGEYDLGFDTQQRMQQSRQFVEDWSKKAVMSTLPELKYFNMYELTPK